MFLPSKTTIKFKPKLLRQKSCKMHNTPDSFNFKKHLIANFHQYIENNKIGISCKIPISYKPNRRKLIRIKSFSFKMLSKSSYLLRKRDLFKYRGIDINQRMQNNIISQSNKI